VQYWGTNTGDELGALHWAPPHPPPLATGPEELGKPLGAAHVVEEQTMLGVEPGARTGDRLGAALGEEPRSRTAVLSG
jgi:hypothetical protein